VHAAGLGVLDRLRRRRRPDPSRLAAGVQLVVADADAAHAELKGRGVDVSEVQDFPWGRFVFFSDPDGNGWAVQEIVTPS